MQKGMSNTIFQTKVYILAERHKECHCGNSHFLLLFFLFLRLLSIFFAKFINFASPEAEMAPNNIPAAFADIAAFNII